MCITHVFQPFPVMGGGSVLPPTGGINFHFRSPSLQLKYLEMPWWPRQRNVPRNHCGLPFGRNIPGRLEAPVSRWFSQPGMIESQWLDDWTIALCVHQSKLTDYFNIFPILKIISRIYMISYTFFLSRQWGLRWFEYQQSCMNMWPQHIGIRYGIQVIRCGKTQ